MTFQNLSDRIEYNRQAIINKDVNFLPLYYTFPKLKTLLPGFIHGDYLNITAGSAVGKSKLAHFICAQLIDLMKLKPKLKINIIFNSLEETEEKLKAMFFVQYLYSYGHELNYYQIMGYSETPITDEQLRLVKEAKRYYKEAIEPHLEIVNIDSTIAFVNHVKERMRAKGTFTTQGEYTSDDINEWWVTVSDHISCYVEEPGMTFAQTIKNFSFNLLRNQLGIKAGVVNIVVQQQVNTKDQIEGNVKPKRLIDKSKPSADGLGDYKSTFRDATIVLGLWNPHAWEEHLPGNNYNGVDLSTGDYRVIRFLKTREAKLEDKEMIVHFNGATNQFYELNTF
jgi:hypothetical protein